jgi:hypothetical protein
MLNLSMYGLPSTGSSDTLSDAMQYMSIAEFYADKAAATSQLDEHELFKGLAVEAMRDSGLFSPAVASMLVATRIFRLAREQRMAA